MPVRDEDGNPICGDLVAAMDAGLMPFPHLRKARKRHSMGRQKIWKQWKAEFEAEGKWLGAYGLRNTYSVRAHEAGVLVQLSRKPWAL